MLIWGSRGRHIEQERGEFYCPQCEESHEYKKMRMATYFTLYFIPLFETKHHGDFIECLNCHGKFKPTVLDLKPTTQAERVIAAVRAELESGTPLQMARTKLTNAGVDLESAATIVVAAAGAQQRSCGQCHLDFIPSIRKCSSCGADLSANTGFHA
jgi:zinc-ribbon family